MIYIANPRGKTRKKKATKAKTKRGSAGRRVKSKTSTKGRHGGTMAKRRKKRRVKARRKNPVRRKRRVRRAKARRRNPVRRRKVARKRRRVKSRRRRRNPKRRRRASTKRRVVRRRKRRANPKRRKSSRRRKVTRRRRRNPSMKFLPSKSYFKTVLGDAAGITAGYLANAGLDMLIVGTPARKGLLTGVLGKIENPHLKFAAQQTLNIITAFAVGTVVSKLGKAKGKRLGENMTIGGLVRVLRATIYYVSGVAGFALGTELLAGGGRMGGYIQQGNVDALESATMAGYMVEGGDLGAYERDYSYDYSMG